MTNKKTLLGILVMVLVFSMTVVGCDNDSTSNGGGSIPSTYHGDWALQYEPDTLRLTLEANKYISHGYSGSTTYDARISDGLLQTKHPDSGNWTNEGPMSMTGTGNSRVMDIAGTKYVPFADNNDSTNENDTVATPTATPSAGEVASGTAITLSTTTSGASIRYTTNGSNPTSTSGIVYSDSSKPTITSTTTIRAVAYKEGMTTSGILTATYTISNDSTKGDGAITITVTGIPDEYGYGCLEAFNAPIFASSYYDAINSLQPISEGSITFDMRYSASTVKFDAPGSYKVYLDLYETYEAALESYDNRDAYTIESKSISAGNNTIPFSEFNKE